MSAARPSAVMPSSRAMRRRCRRRRPASPSSSCTRTAWVDGVDCQPRHDPGRQHRSAAQNVLGVVGQRRGPLLQPDRARERRRTTRIRSRAGGCRPPGAGADPARDARRHARRRHRRAARRRCPTDRSTPDVRAGPARPEDRQPAQFVGFVAGRRVRQHVRLLVLDADHAAGAVGDRLGEPEQVGARVVVRVAAVAVVLEGVVDESVERLPSRPRLDGHDRRAERDGPPDRRIRGFLDEDGRGYASRFRRTAVPASAPRRRRRRPAGRRGPRNRRPTARPSRTSSASTRATERHRHIQAARRLDQRHHRAVQGQQQLAEPEAGVGAAIRPSFVRFDYKLESRFV